jgi:DNA-binding NarL/FixJ family response regulator
VREHHPDLVITDIQLSECSAIGLLLELQKLRPAPRVLVLTAQSEEESIRESLNRGVNGYVLKDSGRAELLLAIRTILSGSQYLCTAVAAKVVSGFVNGREARKSVRPQELVTQRERQVLIQIASGRSNKLIARTLGLSVKTVEKHRANLMRKLTLHNTAAVTMFALKHGFIDAAPPDHPGAQ